MYKDYFKDEALEIYIILGLDINNFELQNIFFMLYNDNYDKDARESLIKIKNYISLNNTITKSNEMYYFENNELYTILKNKILSCDIDSIIKIYNNKMELYSILDKIQSKEIEPESYRSRFNTLTDNIRDYTNKNDLEGYVNYFNNNKNIIFRLFDLKMGNLDFRDLHLLAGLKDRTRKAKYISKEDLKIRKLNSNEKKEIIKKTLPNEIISILVLIFVTIILLPNKELINTSGGYVYLIFTLIVYAIFITKVFENISPLLFINSNIGYIDGFYAITTADSSRHGVKEIYLPSVNRRCDIKCSTKGVRYLDPVTCIRFKNGKLMIIKKI